MAPTEPRLTEAERQRKAAQELAATAPPLGPQQRALLSAIFGPHLGEPAQGGQPGDDPDD